MKPKVQLWMRLEGPWPTTDWSDLRAYGLRCVSFDEMVERMRPLVVRRVNAAVLGLPCDVDVSDIARAALGEGT